MSATRIKFCGVRSTADIAAAAAAGADAVGFNFYGPSPRSVHLHEAIGLARSVPLWVQRVALFVNPEASLVREVAEALGTDTVQLHGAVTAELCDQLEGLTLIAAVPTRPGATLQPLAAVLPRLAAVLVDAAVPGQHGGTGQTADWAEAAAVRADLGDIPMLLAGGLTAHNVQDAIRAVQPYAVDVASGVECSPGQKDAALMRQFAEAVRRTET